MSTIIAVAAAIFWLWVIGAVGHRFWQLVTRPPLDDPNNPPDLRAFAPGRPVRNEDGQS